MAKRKAVYRPKKVKFHGNRYTSKGAARGSPNLQTQSASARKLLNNTDNRACTDDINYGIFLMLV